MAVTSRHRVRGDRADSQSYPYQRVVLVMLIAVLGSGLLARDPSSPFETYQYILLISTLLVGALAVMASSWSRRHNKNDSVHKLFSVGSAVWVVGCAIVLYGMVLSSLRGDSMYLSFSFGMRLVPLALFPLFAFAVTSRQAWLRMFIFLAVLGAATAILDLRKWDGSSLDIVRQMVAEYRGTGVNYFYGFAVALLLWILVPMRPALRMVLALTMLPAAVRIGVSLSRIWYVLLIVAIVYALIISIIWLRKRRASFIVTLGLAAGFVLSFAVWGSQDHLTASYMAAYDERFAVLDQSFQYRLEELDKAIEYGGLLGEGWGASGDFDEVLLFTSTEEYNRTKPYVHNFVGFILWKLGLVGAVSISLLVAYLIGAARRVVARRDDLGFVAIGLWIIWVTNSLATTSYARPELNVWAAAWLGYFAWAGLGRSAQVDEIAEIQVPTVTNMRNRVSGPNERLATFPGSSPHTSNGQVV